MLREEVLSAMSGKDRGGLFAVASQGQHSPEMCHSAAVLEWGKAAGGALYR